MMNIHAILKQLPHRYPFLLVDKVVELERNARILAVKYVTFNEPFFMGHFPGRPMKIISTILLALIRPVLSARSSLVTSCFWRPRLIAFGAEFGNLKVLHVSAMKSLAKPS